MSGLHCIGPDDWTAARELASEMEWTAALSFLRNCDPEHNIRTAVDMRGRILRDFPDSKCAQEGLAVIAHRKAVQERDNERFADVMTEAFFGKDKK